MFGTLLGGLPSPSGSAETEAVEAAVRAQESAGLEPITDGRLRPASPFAIDAATWAGWQAPLTVEAWRATAALTDRAVKQALPGPYSLTRALARSVRARERAALAAADGLHAEVMALAAAGCPLIEIEETAAHLIGDDETERQIYVAAHRRLTEAVEGTHLSLSIVSGSAWAAGASTILDAPYASLAVDLVAGPDNWRLVAVTPGDRGIVAGVVSPGPGGDDGPEVLLWAANYAASTGGRGLARVGLGTAGSLATLTWDAALVKLERLGRAVRIASMPPGEAQAAELDPRSINARSAALGRPVPSRPRPEAGRRGRTIPG
jgi:methionine synthase II (cobalamin-independent)